MKQSSCTGVIEEKRLKTTGVVIGVREGILLGGRKKFALKITICPENNNLP